MPAPTPGNANEFIEIELDDRLKRIEAQFKAHALSFNGPIFSGVDGLVRDAIQHRRASGDDNKRLVVLVTTGGGYIEVVQRIVDTLRKHYDLVDFVIPDHAYSAGTVLAMSGDAIHMDYYSRLGPIDPQVETRDGRMVPALGYLERYNALIDKAKKGTITVAEVQLLIQGFDQAELHQYEQARELSISLLEKWLVKYKFKEWKKTATKGDPVTLEMKRERAREIAKTLNKTTKWHVHGHGISKDVLEKDLNLLIDDFGADDSLESLVRGYHDLLSDYMGKMNKAGVVHVVGHYRPYRSGA